MKAAERAGDVIHRLVQWADSQPLVRAMVLTSSRANDRAPVDLLSDYDVILAVSEMRPFAHEESWLQDYGKVLVLFRDQGQVYGLRTLARLVLYEEGIRIDYSVWPVALLHRMGEKPRLVGQLDVGYLVLVDKDHLTQGLTPPTYTAHIPARPRNKEFQSLVEEFWWETTYVAKNLWRDELLPAKSALDFSLKLQGLRRVLEWRIELDHHWSWKPGVLGRGLKKLLPSETWAELASTYVGQDLDENWEALFQTTSLFRSVAVEVGEALGYGYPYDLDQRVTAYLQSVRNLERERNHFA